MGLALSVCEGGWAVDSRLQAPGHLRQPAAPQADGVHAGAEAGGGQDGSELQLLTQTVTVTLIWLQRIIKYVTRNGVILKYW